ncbi:MAG: flagellar cap protein [Carnobacterium sp.]|uniref:flagellar cap protein n=1 Tax=Carnobacterium sp. TaxID=48221 RepID=UPI003C7612DE
MTTSNDWNQVRSNLLDTIWQLLTSWDGTTEDALVITEKNQDNIIQWQKINKQVATNDFLSYTETEKEKQADILRFQQMILTSIGNERSVVVSQMKQINQKNKVRDNYVSVKREPLFVDKGL